LREGGQLDKDILSVIREASAGFSKGQRKIAKYILENYDKAAFMTASKLGTTVNVSESTVVRFAAELGYDGYPAMRKALQEMIRNCLTSVQRIEVAREMLEHHDILTAVLSSDVEKIRMTLQETNRADFEAAVEAIVGAKNIYVIGLRSAMALANFIGFYFNLLLDNVHVVSEISASEVFEQIMRVSEGDVFIGISFPRYSRRTIKAMQYARDMGAKVIGLTDVEASPIAQIASIRLYARSDMVSFLDSLVAPLSLINALIGATSAKTQGDLSSNFERLEKIWAEYEVY
jgi:DNA-binding MurR/RpiR family transcriptional regulator